MKKLLPFLSFLILSCGASTSSRVIPKIDTVQVVCRQNDNLIFIDSAIRMVYEKRGFKNDSSLDGVMTRGTSYRLLQAADTLRDSLRRPLFDANHNPRWLNKYSQVAVTDSMNKYIQVIEIPKWNK